MTDTITATPVADAIRAMQDRLGRPEWWCQGTLHKGVVAACIRGAQFDVTTDIDELEELSAVLNDVVEGWTGDEFETVSGFNDALTTTHDDILLFLDAALDVAEAEGL